MSTLKATNIKNVSSGTNNIVLGENGGVVISGLATVSNANVTGGSITGVSTVSSTAFSVNGNTYPSAGPLSNRNLIINGAMQVAQRGTSQASVTSTGYYTCDRWYNSNTGLGTWTLSQSTTAPSGFANSFKWDCTTADASPAAGDLIIHQQRIESQNLQHLNKGTSDALPVTLSFWVRSNKTGTYTLEIYDDANTRSIGKTYTIDSADTWEYKTITIEGDTTGTLDDDNTRGFDVLWWLAAGSNYTSGTFSTSWAANVGANRVSSSQVNLADSTSNEWYITGVQLEVGSVATPFEHRSYGDELRRCQRYFYKHNLTEGSTSIAHGGCFTSVMFIGAIAAPVTFRDTPSVSVSGSLEVTDGTSNFSASSITLNNNSPGNNFVQVRAVISGATQGRVAIFRPAGDSSATFTLSSEL
jgi:hypothetical protein